MTYRLIFVCVLALTIAGVETTTAQDLRSRLEGLVYEVEEWTTPADAWQKDKFSANKWNLWTTEEDVHKKRSKGASLQSPRVEKDRATAEEGAPPLHTHITGIPNGLYHVFQSPPNRAIAVSYDGKTWTKHTGGEVYHGLLNITDGTFDLWVDDRYAHPANLGTCYYDYIRFVKAEPPKFERFAAFMLPDGQTQLSWITDGRMPTGAVEFGVGDRFDQRVISPETGLRNHRVVLGQLDPTKEYAARVAFAVGKGALSSAVFKFRPAPLRPSKPSTAARIPLTVAEPTRHGRAQWPVVSGLPFAQAALADPADVQVLDGIGKSIPAHAYAQSRWPDGSVKWLAIEALVDTAPGKPTALALAVQPGAQKAPTAVAAAVKLAESPDGWLLQNGKLQFHISKKSFALFDRVSYDANGDGQFSADELMTGEPQLNNGMIQDAAGKRYGLGPPDAVKVETASALRAVIRVEGDFVSPEGQRLFRYRGRITCCANQPFFKLEWTVGNNGVTDLFTPLSGAALRLPIRADGGVEGQLNRGKFMPVRGDNDLWLLQDDDNHFSLTASGSTTAGEHAVGLASVRSGQRQITAHVRHFWQTFPKGYAVKPDGIHIRLLPALPTGLYAKHKADEVVKWSYWYRDGKYLFKRGLECTSEVFVHFGAASDGLAEHFEQPLFAVAPADVYCKSRAFGPVLPRAEGEFATYEKMVDGGFERLEQNRLKKREYGWMNFGDWHGERRDNWGNSEYDLQWGLGLHFARTGDLRYLWRGEEMARHTVSIDTVHYPWSPRMPGLVYVHCVGHVGDFFAKDDERVKEWSGIYGRGILPGAIDAQGHIFQEGNFLYGWLMADPRYVEVAERVCGHQAAYLTPSFNFGIERAAGWPLINAMAAYDNTGNPFYLNAARLYLEKIFALQDPETGGWRMPQGPPECDHTEKHIGGKTFATGILLCGLRMYHQVDPTPEVKQCILRGCDWLMNHAWDPEGRGFRYKTGCPKYLRATSPGASGALVALGLTYASQLSGDPKYREFLLSWFSRCFGGPPGDGKGYAMMIRQVVYALRDLKQLGMTELPGATPPPKVVLRRRVPLRDGQATVYAFAQSGSGKPEPMKLAVTASPPGWLVQPRAVEWQVSGNIQRSPAITVKPSPQGRSGVVKLECQAGNQRPVPMEVEIVSSTLPAFELGPRIGFLGPADHFTLKALTTVGARVELLGQVTPASLKGFGAVVVAADLLAKNPELYVPAFQTLNDFVAAGGKLALFQLNDDAWKLDYLPYDLLVDDENTVAEAVVAADHWLFGEPKKPVPSIGTGFWAKVNDLDSAVCYDSIVYADPAWRTLARDNRGRPCVLAADYGKGSILVIEPSFDRYVAGTEEVPPSALEQARRLVANLCSALTRN